MITFIPIEYYVPLFYYFTLVLVLMVWSKVGQSQKLDVNPAAAVFSVWGLVLYMGLRPISIYFGDMGGYAQTFEMVQAGNEMLFKGDFGFDVFFKFCAGIMPVEFFFLLVAFLYVYSHYLAAKNIFQDYWYYAFIILVGSFSFWSYGTNGIRNGLGAAFVLLAFSFERKKALAVGIALLAVTFHKAMLLPVAAYFLTFIYNKPKTYIYFWLLCIPLSLVLGGSFEALFASLGFGDERMSYLTEGNVNDDEFSSTGFRWDFLLYSATAVYAGWYFIIKKKFEDVLYSRLFNTYLIANAFWILVIRANFSNRFAYLSWFMMALVIIYPFLKGNFMPNQPKKMGLVILLYFMFTFLLNVVLAK